jgi:hypothetical protein
MKKITYYVGVLPEHQSRFHDFVSSLNEDSDSMYNVKIVGEFDADYYTFSVRGTWESYKCFAVCCNSFVKSLEHFEED